MPLGASLTTPCAGSCAARISTPKTLILTAGKGAPPASCAISSRRITPGRFGLGCAMGSARRALPCREGSEMSAEAAHEEFHLSAELRSTCGQLRSRAGTIALVCLCFGAAALAYLAIVPPRYTASTEIFLDPRGLQVVANDVSPRAESNEFSVVESQLRVAQSEGVLREGRPTVGPRAGRRVRSPARDTVRSAVHVCADCH